MREIKFRAVIMTTSKYAFYGKGLTLIEISRLNDEFFQEDVIWLEFTGLKDKNGKEIYEGDVLKLDGGGKPCVGSVGFERGCFVFNASWLNEEKEYMPELYRYTFFAELEKGKLFKDCVVVEIIGNIYENPELLKTE